MKLRAIFVVVGYMSYCSTLCQPPVAIDWQKCHGNASSNGFLNIRQCADNSFIATGRTHGLACSTTADSNFWNYWVAKLDGDGDLVWQDCFGGTMDDQALSVEQTSDGGYIVVGYANSNNQLVVGQHGNSDCWLLKLDALGAFQWQKCLGSGYFDYGRSVKELPGGGYVVVGTAGSGGGDVSQPLGDFDLWLMMLDDSGELISETTLGGTASDVGYDITLTADDGFIVVGSTESNDLDVSGALGGQDAWVVKLDGAGAIQWQACFGGSADDHAYRILNTTDMGYLLVGTTSSNDGMVTEAHGGQDAWVVKLDATGALEWQKTLGGSGNDMGFGIAQTATGLFVCGETGSSDGDALNWHGGWRDGFVAKLTMEGELEWFHCLGGSDLDALFAVQVNAQGGLVLAGLTYSEDGDVWNNAGSEDAWIVQLTSDFNLVQGSVYVDLNSNGAWDPTEPPLTDQIVSLQGADRFAFTQPLGEYAMSILSPGIFDVLPPTIDYYTNSPASRTVSFIGFNEVLTGQDFALQPIGEINDLKVTLISGPLRPGMQGYYTVHYQNVGTTTLTPSVMLQLDPGATFMAASIGPTTIGSNEITWELAPLGPFDQGSIIVSVDISAMLSTGDLLSSVAEIGLLVSDANMANNSAVCQTVLTASFDPNDISVDRESLIFSELVAPPFLDYLIRFQNTGTDTAFVVRVETDLPSELDAASMQMVATSHPAQISYTSYARRLVFRFDDILLPDSSTNELLSHGYVRYRIKPRTDLAVGDSVLCNASIFFDLNVPVITNTAHTVIDTETSSYNRYPAPRMLEISPNPGDGCFVILFDNGAMDLNIIDLRGRVVHMQSVQPGEIVDARHLNDGLYIVRARDQAGRIRWTRISIHD